VRLFKRRPPEIRISVDAAGVERALEDYLTAASDDPDVLHNARVHHALPISKDMGGALYLRPDGHILSSGWDTPREVEPVVDIRQHRDILHAARAHAAQQFPDIIGLLPERGPQAVNCMSCDGHGRLKGISDKYPNVVCACGGLGWIPEPPEPRVSAVR